MSDNNQQARPLCPENRTEYCTIRFLHSAARQDAVNICIGNKPLAFNLQYGEVSSYYIETAGFKTINITNAKMPNMILERETFLFQDGDVYTIALVNGRNGFAMYPISDAPCRTIRQKFSCVRAVNLSYNSPALNVTAQRGMICFEDLRFKTIAPYRQIIQGKQEFYVSETASGAAAFHTTQSITQGRMYTLYIIGDTYGSPDLSPVFTEDYSGLQD